MLKRLLSVILTVMFIATFAAGCGKSTVVETTGTQVSSTTAAQTTEKVDTGVPSEFKKVTFVFYGDMSARMQSFSQTELKEKLLADLNTELNLQYLPWGEYGPGKKVDLMLAAGEELDAFLGDKGWMSLLIAKNMLMDLTEIADKYLPDLKNVVAPEAFDFFKINGKLYSIPIGNKPTADMFYNVCVRQDLLEEAGMSEIKTMDDLTAFAEKCKALHSDMYATPDLFPTAYLRGLSDKNYTLYDHYLIDQDNPDKLEYLFDSEIFKKFCSYTNDWFKKGLTPTDLLTNTSGSAALFESGKYMWFRGTCGTTLTENYPNLKKNVPTAKIKEYSLAPEKSKYKLYFHNTNFLVPVYSKNADRAAMVINYMQKSSDIVDFLGYGVKDKDYKLVGDKIERISTDELFYPWMLFNVKLSRYTSDTPDEFIEEYKKWDDGYKTAKEFMFTLNSEPIKGEKAKTAAVIQEKINPIMYGIVDFDKNFDKAMGELNTAGKDKMVEEVQNQWTQYLATQK